MDEKQEPQNNNVKTSNQNKPINSETEQLIPKETIIDSDNNPQPTKQLNSCGKNKTNTKRIILITSLILGSIILFFAIILPAYRYLKPFFFGPSLSEYESYLAEKYKDDTFYYVSGNPSCGWFNSGFCTAVFSSTSLGNNTFTVTASRNSFSDNYYEIRYGFNLEDYYHEKYGEFLKNTISDLTPYPVRATIKNLSESSIPKSSFDSFDDYIAALEQKGEDNVKVYLTINSTNIDIYNLDNIDFALIESEISKAIEQNNLKLSSVNLVVINHKTEYTGVCPEEFDHTIRSHAYSSYGREGTEDESDGRSIDSCLRIIYSKT